MNETVKKLLLKLKSPRVIVIAGMCGMGLILLSTFFSGGTKEKSAVRENNLDTAEYCSLLKSDISEMVTGITGSESVTVTITLDSGVRYSYADAVNTNSTSKSESSGESGSNQTEQSYITVKTADGGEQALLVTEIMPEVRGVAIICEGGDNEETAQKIQSAVMAALNITSKRVFVAGGTVYEKR